MDGSAIQAMVLIGFCVGAFVLFIFWNYCQELSHSGSSKTLLAVGIALTVGTIFLCKHLLKLSKSLLEISPKGVARVEAGGERVFLAWDEISRVYERRAMQQLAVADPSGAKRVVIDYQFKDYDGIRERIFREFVERMMLPPFPIIIKSPSPFVFNFLLMGLSFLVFSVGLYFCFMRDHFMSILFMVFSAVFAGIYYVDRKNPRTIIVNPNDLTIVSLLKKDHFSFYEVKGVDWEYLSNRNGGKYSWVRLLMKNREDIFLTARMGSVPEIYFTLKKVLEDFRQRSK